MDRIENVRKVVDEIVLNIVDAEERRCAYLHLYGVSQACALLAMKRQENIELATIAGMLHDIYSYANMDSKDHAHKGAEMARDILVSLNEFSEEEINLICTAIYNHSDKLDIHGVLDEILKDADVMQHVLYNPLFSVKANEQKRFDSLKVEFNLQI
ncbi:MAG: HD domain-containing protein [Erysipelotrichales bacterium]|nr:HD domain-containing protein [Erysipelotrichales bacterium]